MNKKYSLIDRGNLVAAGLLRVASVPPAVARRNKWARLLATLSRGRARHNTRGSSAVVDVYPAAELADLGVPCNSWGYVEV